MAEIKAAAGGDESTAAIGGARLITQRVGETTAYFLITGDTLPVVSDNVPHGVSLTSLPVFEQAAEVVRGAITQITSRLWDCAADVRPTELEVELSFSFEATGRTTIVPFLISGDSKASTGLKIKATWTKSSMDRHTVTAPVVPEAK